MEIYEDQIDNADIFDAHKKPMKKSTKYRYDMINKIEKDVDYAKKMYQRIQMDRSNRYNVCLSYVIAVNLYNHALTLWNYITDTAFTEPKNKQYTRDEIIKSICEMHKDMKENNFSELELKLACVGINDNIDINIKYTRYLANIINGIRTNMGQHEMKSII